SGFIDMAGGGNEFCPCAFAYAAVSVCVAAHINDRRNRGDGFTIDHNSRATIEANDGREGGFTTRVPAPSFKGFDLSCRCAADVSARARVYIQLQRVAGSENILTQEARCSSLLDRSFEDREDPSKFATHVDIGGIRTERITRHDHPFDQYVGQMLHQVTILKC